MRGGILALLLTAAAGVAPGQSPEEKPSHPPHAIQDNSFLVEEAYNQEEDIEPRAVFDPSVPLLRASLPSSQTGLTSV